MYTDKSELQIESQFHTNVTTHHSNLALFPPPVFHCLQYANMEGEGLGDLVMCGDVRYLWYACTYGAAQMQRLYMKWSNSFV